MFDNRIGFKKFPSSIMPALRKEKEKRLTAITSHDLKVVQKILLFSEILQKVPSNSI